MGGNSEIPNMNYEISKKFKFIQASVNCIIKNEGSNEETPCKGNIDSSRFCEDIPVQYQWKVCNNEDKAIRINRAKSNYKYDGKIEGDIDEVIEPKQCNEYLKDSVMNTCEKDRVVNTCKYIQVKHLQNHLQIKRFKFTADSLKQHILT